MSMGELEQSPSAEMDDNAFLKTNGRPVEPAKTSKLLQLANDIHNQVTEIQKYLEKTEQPDPCFEGDAQPVDFAGIEDTRSQALENLTELTELLLKPSELLHTKTPVDLLSRHAIDRFNLTQAIPVKGTRTYEELAWATMLPVKTIKRILRHAISQRIFYEPQPGVVAHTQASRLLAENSAYRDYYGTVCQEVWPAATRTCDAIRKWPGSKERNETGYQLAYGRTLYDTLAQDPVKHARYDNAMGAHAGDVSYSVKPIIDNFDWAGLGQATVVDVGGGVGTVSKALAKAFPSLSFVVEDQPEVVKNAVVDDPDIRDRIRFLEHDFFQPQPVKDAAVYFIRRVLMEWPDDKAVDMFKALKPALKVGARVVIQDPYLPDPGTCPMWQQRRFRNSDLLALAVANAGSPRESEDWKALFGRAGPGYEFKGVTLVPNSDVALAEAVWQGEPIANGLHVQDDVGTEESVSAVTEEGTSPAAEV